MLPFHAVVPFFTDVFFSKFSPKHTVWGSPVSTEVALHLSPLVVRAPPAPNPTDGPYGNTGCGVFKREVQN